MNQNDFRTKAWDHMNNYPYNKNLPYSPESLNYKLQLWDTFFFLY